MAHLDTFDVATLIGGNIYRFSISPAWDETEQHGYYLAKLDDKEVGRLRKTDSDYWYWELGSTKFNASIAYYIGQEIDSYYSKALTA